MEKLELILILLILVALTELIKYIKKWPPTVLRKLGDYFFST